MVVVLRREVGDVLRTRRVDLGRTLRDVSAQASVSLGYLSEVERGEKEASSELLASICAALELPMSAMLRDVSERVERAENIHRVAAVAVSAPVSLPVRSNRMKAASNAAVRASAA